jgi:diadenylate cyclase
MELLRQIRWQDIVDIVVMSIIVYRLLLMIKGTKAAHMLIGLGVLLIASLLSRYFELYTVDWLIQSFWSQIVIALIILFQPEIRRALAQMGETQFIHVLTPAEELKSLDEIVKAAIALSNRKIGALIAIERETSLRDFVEIGTPLDGKVSKELLLSIFHPTSPIHDGAVVIKGNRIIAAGCFLPITMDTDVSKALGTRHRSGIGLSEETDAVVIIVSEETGTVSMAMNGRMESPLDMGMLRDILTDLGIEMVNHNIKMVTLTIKGQEGLIKNLKPSDVRVSVDLSKAKKGEGLYYIQRDNIKIPHGFLITSIEPSVVKVVTAETVTKIVRVVPVVAGEPSQGYHIKSIEVAPQTVIIEGVRSEISRISTLKTEPVDIAGVNETVTQDAKLDLEGRNVRSKTNIISVRIVIGGPRR